MRDESIRETLEDLTREEARLATADGELARAKARYQVASRRYAAVRDVAEEMLGQNPYHPDAYMTFWERLDEMPPVWGISGTWAWAVVMLCWIFFGAVVAAGR